ncbi:hypothetical protein DQ04_06121010 [Trypanosoma grayi]|uniref:hypothetical protein n=1 Tax=Trypanosoma grayi TaxID=71804 RepID=UPI0004F47D1A|nr:hypothetical protein DQ04_06121010 [Trypanosoma grayi]KEG08950.1 hypothetical protein DQ04_06121010 [Trypanosoma grayi]
MLSSSGIGMSHRNARRTLQVVVTDVLRRGIRSSAAIASTITFSHCTSFWMSASPEALAASGCRKRWRRCDERCVSWRNSAPLRQARTFNNDSSTSGAAPGRRASTASPRSVSDSAAKKLSCIPGSVRSSERRSLPAASAERGSTRNDCTSVVRGDPTENGAAAAVVGLAGTMRLRKKHCNKCGWFSCACVLLCTAKAWRILQMFMIGMACS